MRWASLDWLNFTLADVRGSLGPYLGIFLLTERHWDPATIGIVATVAGIVGLVVHAPIGAFIDATRWKRGAVVAGLGVLTASALAIATAPNVPVVLTAQTMMAVAGAFFGPAIAAITLGILGSHGLAYRTGRNAAFDHAGNVSIAIVAGVVGWWFSQSAVFFLVPIFSVLAALSVLSIPASAIDHARARGLDRTDPVGGEQPSGLSVLLTCRPLLIFAVCVALFHFANAAMLPLVVQKLALAHKGQETPLMSACIVAAQVVMLPMALLAGARADAWGRKPIFLAAFAILPLRGVLYTVSDDRFWLIAVQLLDGVGAGIFGVLTPLVLADLMRGTGRYNVSRGAVATVQGIGASLSNIVAGVIVVNAGYSAAFLTLAGVALAAFMVFLIAMPETGEDTKKQRHEPATMGEPAQAAMAGTVIGSG
ncbi:MFS transporter [Bradyrhizobium sp. NAS96.2]|uniref:MFS transporter n=1 Tax=Bradyrhizobium sp. NAS96.2 TaxID=1680160 RepID=UPI00093BCB2F|nr:MFS transporter [Bradyrhizobium sp. NAS96.2]OKO81376.1 MFS transporter [Bradyrhizobium sp. NAS96.2]